MKTKDIFMYSLAALIILVFFTLMGMLVLKAVPIDNKDLFNCMTGFSGAGFGAVINYFFGSSSGSKEKTELLSKQSN